MISAALGAGAVGLMSAFAGAVPSYTLGTAEERGFFSEFGSLVAAVVARSSPGFTLTTRSTSGTVDNLAMLAQGSFDMGLALSDAAIETGGLLALGRVYLNYIQVVVPAGSPVRRFSDLRGKAVGLGVGSGTARAGQRIVEASGTELSDLRIVPVPVVDILARLGDGAIEAALFAGGVPHPSVDPRPGQPDIRLLDLSAELTALQKRNGAVYERAVVPVGTYRSLTQTTTVGVASLLLTRPALPDGAAAGIVDVIIDHASELIPSGTLGVQYLDARSLTYTFGVPLHPAAAAAYRRRHG